MFDSLRSRGAYPAIPVWDWWGMKVLFFAPFSAVWEHSFPEALVADILQKGGHEVVYVTCGREFPGYCMSMSARGLYHDSPDGDKRFVCDLCVKNKQMLKDEFHLEGGDIAALLTQEDRRRVAELMEKSNQENFLELSVDGVEVGKIALYELVLQNKKITLTFSEREWAQYRIALENALKSYFAARRTLERERPDVIVLYSAFYSINNVWKKVALQLGIIPYAIEGGPNHAERRSTLILVRDDLDIGSAYYFRSAMDHWETYKNLPITPDQADSVTNHFLELLGGGGFVYSSPRTGTDIRARYGIGDDQKLIVAAMSSYDEIVAAEIVGIKLFPKGMLFPTQEEWVRYLIEFASRNPELFILLRVHPREFPLRGSRVLAENAKKMKGILSNLPSNMAVNWPTDMISLYDVMEEADLVLNGWSSAGAEAGLFGLPVVGYMQLSSYPASLNYIGSTLVEYERQIWAALADGWQAERITMSYRWFSLYLCRSLLNIADGFGLKPLSVRRHPEQLLTEPVYSIRDIYEKLRRKLNPAYVPVVSQERNCHKRARDLAVAESVRAVIEGRRHNVLDLGGPQATVGPEDEARLIRGGIGRIARAMHLHGSQPSRLQRRLREFASGSG